MKSFFFRTQSLGFLLLNIFLQNSINLFYSAKEDLSRPSEVRETQVIKLTHVGTADTEDDDDDDGEDDDNDGEDGEDDDYDDEDDQ